MNSSESPAKSATGHEQPLHVRWPAEWGPHKATWMAGPTAEISAERLVDAQHDVLRLANAIAGFEPMRLIVSEDSCPVARRQWLAAVSEMQT